MAINLNKSKFMTKIGIMYYLWKHVDGIVTISYLGIGKDSFLRYIKKLENKGKDRGRVLLNDKKSEDIENKILQYLDGSVKNLDLKIGFLSGTEFQKKIWNTATFVPYGKTASYKELADISGYSKAWRAAGTALKNNPIILAVPCHRIINENGRISKFILGKKIKRFLLDLEQSFKEKLS
jgi:O-6-methylguanine DNA methyltransferase